MDYDDEDVAAMLGGAPSHLPPPRLPCPRTGQNRDFDAFVDQVLAGDDGDDPVDIEELRKALWATWKTSAPSGRAGPSSRPDGDDELARALSLSAKEHSARASRQSSIHEVADDSDEELRRAIALSQQEGRAPKRQKREETPEEERRMLAEAMAASLANEASNGAVSEQSDDEDLKAANEAFQASRRAFRDEEMSRRQAQSSSLAGPSVSASVNGSQTTPVAGPSASTGLSSLLGDRAQMERERLARQAARLGQTQAATAPPSQTAEPQPAKTEASAPPVPVARGRHAGNQPVVIRPPPFSASGPSRSFGTTSNGSTSGRGKHHPLQGAGPFPSDAAGEYYLDGELRHTALNIGNPSQAPTFAPNQLIGKKSEIALIILSSFVLDDAWMSGVLPRSEEVPTIIIRPHPKDKHPQWNGKVQAQMEGEVYCYPQMVGEYGSAHMKFAWIFYKTGRLRVAIMTCNMVPYDWEWIENTVFIQDFLPLRTPVPPAPSTPGEDLTSRFKHLFVHLKVHKALRHLGQSHPFGAQTGFSPDHAFRDLNKWDWSRVKVRLVMSVPGNYEGIGEGGVEEWGIARLGKVVHDEGWGPGSSETVKAEFQGSSLGNYSLDWFSTFYNFVCGKTVGDLIGRPKANAWPPIHVLFPSLATVDKSILGRDGGGTMFCGKAMNSVTRPLFHDANSKRGGVLMHSKVLIALYEPKGQSLGLTASPSKSGEKRKADEMGRDGGTGGRSKVGGWVYVGSHNFSSAAWGTVYLKKNPPTMNVRNYELGILFPLPREGAKEAADVIAPYVRPPRKYSADDQPWDQKLHGTA